MLPEPDTPAEGPTEEEFTQLLNRAEVGDSLAGGEILPLIYQELRKLAALRLSREAPGQTLQPTALVHEAWLRLNQARPQKWKNRAHFFGAAAEAMRRILIENARRRHAVRHGGGMMKVSEREALLKIAAPQSDDELLLLHDAIDALERHDARKAELVKLRYFAGMELAEAAVVMEISARTAARDWIYARAWLFNEITRLRG